MARVRAGAAMPVSEARVEIGRGEMESILSRAKGDRKTHQG